MQEPKWYDREASAPLCLIAILLAWATVMVWAAIIDTPYPQQPVVHDVLSYSGR